MEAVRRLAAGEQLLSQQEVIEALRFIGRERESDREARLLSAKLTAREREVLQALAEGLSDKEIARAASRRRGNGHTHVSEHPLQARGLFEAAGARLRRAPRPGHDRVILNSTLGRALPRPSRKLGPRTTPRPAPPPKSTPQQQNPQKTPGPLVVLHTTCLYRMYRDKDP